MSVQIFVEQSIARQAARLKALKKIKAVLAVLSDEDARAVISDLVAVVDLEPVS